ncbi:HAD family hydrolase [Jannaschia sp. W003]|uniref:HAD family hydrolase n=1 Tax=Jannaschia sp. W003 TaxID=2867012 RepID=UPI0021A697DB|nr:HAD family hydrolase [Jannaschia sp. W003]UWQ22704.1 HAD family hydrolase [Jannaschia sp. W003]
MSRLETIAFDADDTLWQNEAFFRLTQERFADLLRADAGTDHLMERLEAAERRNLGHYGFGIKAFTLTMIETAIEVSEGRVQASVIAEIMAAGREMLRHPVDLLPHARETVEALAADHRVVLITKGDLLDQERKLAQSGLGDLFDAVEIVSHKVPEVYRRAFPDPSRALMVGNSVRSDVIPAIEAGAWGVHVPSEIEWALEAAEVPEGHPRFRAIAHLGELPGLVAGL